MSALEHRTVLEVESRSPVDRLRGIIDRVPDWAWLLLRLALWAAAFLVAFEAQLRLEDKDGMRLAAFFMGVAVLLVVAATWRMGRGDDAVDAGEPLSVRLRRPTFAIPVALAVTGVALGIAFRVFRLDSEPAGIWFDEAQNALIARAILDGDFPSIFIGRFTQLPSLFFYFYAAAFWLGGESILTLRSFTTLGGLLALPLVFLLGRELFGWKVGALSVFILAVMRWHVNFSRFGVTNIWATFFALGAIYFLVRGLRGKGWWNLVVAGVFTGLGPYSGFYFAFFPGVLLVFWAHMAFSDRRLEWRNHVLAMAIVGVVAMAIYSPVGWWASQNWDDFTDRPSSASILEDKSRDEQIDAVLKSTKQHALMFNSEGDRNGRHNLPGAPLLDSFTGVFFVLGIGIAGARVLRPQYFLLLAWLAIMLQSGIWSNAFEAPQAFRTSTVTPAVAMLAALPLAGLWSIAASRLPPPGDGRRLAIGGLSLPRPAISTRYAVAGLVALTIAFFCAQIAYRNFDGYFNDQLRDPAAWAAYSTAPTIVANQIDDLDPGTEIRMSTLFVGQPTMEFVNPEIDESQLGFDWVLDLPSASDGAAAYYLDQTKEPFVDFLAQLYPGATFLQHTPPGTTRPIVVHEILVSEDDVRQLHGIDGMYTTADGETITARERALDLDWSSGAPGAFPIEAAWSGYIEMRELADYRLRLDLPGSARLLIDGRLVAEGERRVEDVLRLYKGEHELRIEATIDEPGPILLTQDGEPVSPQAFFSYALAGHGLVGTFFSNENFDGVAVHQELDPLVGFRFHAELTVAHPPFSVLWEGLLDVPFAGDYAFDWQALDVGELFLDGDQVDPGTVTLTEGLHEIQVRFRNVSGGANMTLYWTPPNEERRVIPPQRLLPR